MKILIVCKANFEITDENFQKHRAYIYDQVKALRERDENVEVLFIEGTGITSYLRGFFKLRDHLKTHVYDIVHGHYGYIGFLLAMTKKYPTVVTYHGTDIFEKVSRLISAFSILRADWNVFVSQKLYNISLVKPANNYSIFPCGVDFKLFIPMEKKAASKALGLAPERKRVLFSSAFSNPIKNFKLAEQAIGKIVDHEFDVIELKGRTRNEVALLFNACDLLLITSFFEGSSQVAKEALACNCPIISTDVGDIKNFMGESSNCFIVNFDPDEIATRISQILSTKERSDGREQIRYLSQETYFFKTLKIYRSIGAIAYING